MRKKTTFSSIPKIQRGNIHCIFPTPIYRSNFSRPFTSKESKFASSQIDHCLEAPTVLTRQTKDNYILNNKVFSNIKKEIELFLQDYIDRVICPREEFELYITQSWLNYALKGQSHPHHTHSNSYISGVLYFNADKTKDRIYFEKSGYMQITPPVKTWEIWNSHSWWFPVETGSIIIFPSSTTHRVAPKEENNTRISLSFNTFIKGDLGDLKMLTKLKL